MTAEVFIKNKVLPNVSDPACIRYITKRLSILRDCFCRSLHEVVVRMMNALTSCGLPHWSLNFESRCECELRVEINVGLT